MRRDTEEYEKKRRRKKKRNEEEGKGTKKRAGIDPVYACVVCTAARNKTPWCYQNSRGAVALV